MHTQAAEYLRRFSLLQQSSKRKHAPAHRTHPRLTILIPEQRNSAPQHLDFLGLARFQVLSQACGIPKAVEVPASLADLLEALADRELAGGPAEHVTKQRRPRGVKRYLT